MGGFFGGVVLPLLILTAALTNWSLVSLIDLIASLFILLTAPKIGSHSGQRFLLSYYFVVFSLLVFLSHAVFWIILAIEGEQWSVTHARWLKLFGFIQDQSWRLPSVIYFLLLQLLALFVAFIEVYGRELFPKLFREDNWLLHFSSSFEQIGPYFKVVCCLLLPAVQLVVGISHPSWLSLPFFVCSCIGLVDWSLTSNFLGLFRWWWYLLFYSGFNIILLYIYQLPIEISVEFQWFFNFFGLYKICRKSEWSEICSSLSLLLFYVMLSCIRCDLTEMNINIFAREINLTEQLLPSNHSFLIRQPRSGIRQTNVLMKGLVFGTFCINFFTYGFPISLCVLSFWSFQFASLCAFWLLAYIGYLLYFLPSLFHMHRLNGLLLVFVLLWATSTYIFNVAFTIFNKKLLKAVGSQSIMCFFDILCLQGGKSNDQETQGWGVILTCNVPRSRNPLFKSVKDIKVWETIGLWHYPIPGLFLLCQFCLGILVAMGNLVNSSVFLYLSDRDEHPPNRDYSFDEKEETKVLIVATIAWALRKSSRAITIVLLFLIALKPGFVHAAYMVLFLIYLLSHDINRKIRHCLILLCEVHFALLYILQLNLISKALEEKGQLAWKILSQLGVLHKATTSDFMKIGLLCCFCAIQNHAFDMLFALSEVVRHTPFPPIGWNILKAGLNKSILSSIYTPMTPDNSEINSSKEKRIASYISAMRHNILSIYRSCGSYIVCLTILLTVYLVNPNYASFGYLFFLLLWMNGRQLVGKTSRRLWFPLKVYAVIIFIIIYSMSAFKSFETYLAGTIDLYPGFGYDPNASMIKNVWESLAVLIVIELYSYERRLSKSVKLGDYGLLDFSIFSFIKRLLVWHSEKLLYLSLLYASLSPVSAFGFVYLLGLVICSPLPKSSRVPSKIFMVYSGFLLMFDYLFQLWGGRAQMFPGQRHSYLSFFMGLQLFKPGFFGLESGMRGKVLVIVACVLQYNVFHWMENMPSDNTKSKGKWEEPCGLFHSTKENRPLVNGVASISEKECGASIDPVLEKKNQATSDNHRPPAHSSRIPRVPKPPNNNTSESGNNTEGKSTHPYKYIWGGTKENHKWNKKWVFLLRKERLDMQKTTLKIYLKYCVENMFSLFGLEINMIALLVASFAVLNAVSLLYIASLAACVLIPRRVIRRVWPVFVVCFASVLTLEYLASWLNVTSWKHEFPSKEKVACHDCWRSSNLFFDYCKKCWLGVIVDDPRMLISYYVVFVLACFNLRAHRLSGPSFRNYQQMKKSALLINLSFETKSMWTFLDNLRLYCYCHIMDLVLALILVTGTLEYDILHLGYLGFALSFFQRRLEILKKKNQVFKFLRMYNFALIVFSLAYQAPFIGGFSDGKCETIDYIYEVIGFYKYDYGFRITSRSALVEIIIFMLVALQSYMFSSQEFDYVSKYLEAEHIDALVREQEKRAAWKTAQLQHIRKSEEEKRLRNFQVEKMKAEMLNLQIHLHDLSTIASCGITSPCSEGPQRRRNSSLSSYKEGTSTDKEEYGLKNLSMSAENLFPFELNTSPTSLRTRTLSCAESTVNSVDSIQEIRELKEKPFSDEFIEFDKKTISKKQNPFTSAVHIFGDGVHQVQSLSNRAVSNLVNYFNIEFEEQDLGSQIYENEVYNELESQRIGCETVERTFSAQSSSERNTSYSTWVQIGIIFRYMWAQMRSNNDVVCYCCFVLVFLWNFSLLSMVYLVALFLYALCVNTGPGYMFWVVTLIYSEICILLQYLYQILIQHCGFRFRLSFLQELGFPDYKIPSSFVIANLPLFLVYIFTLLQTSITARDGEWASVTEFSSLKRRIKNQKESLEDLNCWEILQHMILRVIDLLKKTVTGLYRYWKSVTEGAETPPYFIQLSMEVSLWPNDGIQPERIESGINKLLKTMHDLRCIEKNRNFLDSPSMVRVQSIERSSENPNVALAVFEVVYVSPSTEPVPGDFYKSLTPAADVANEIQTAHRAGICRQTGFPYPILSVIGGGRRELDLYAYIFCADLAVFFLVAIFYQSVIKNNSEFFEVYQLEDQFPKEFVFVLMIIFFLIVVDRIIYLCSFATGKVLFYLFTLVLFTYSVIEYAWNMQPSHQQHAGRFALRAIFLTKAISLSLQAKQIRYGIPRESTLYRQFLTSSVSHIYYLGFRLYRALPFLYELRCVLDWSCTTTSLTMYDWLKLEDIHSSLFLVKCDVDLNRVRHQQGEKQTKMTKFCNGICLFLVLLCVIWAPMLMYSSGNPTNIANPIKDASAQIDLKTEDGKLTIFRTTLCRKISWDELDKHIDLDPEGYLSSYNENDIQLICCQSDSSSLWLVPPVVQATFRKSIEGSMDFIFSWRFTRDRPKGKEVVKYDLHIQDEALPKPSQVIQVLNGTSNEFRIYDVYPRYFRVTGSGEVRFLERTVDLVSGDLVLNRGNPEWWSFHDVNASDTRGCGGLSGPMAIIVSEETPQGILGETLSKFSIWGLYITFVLAVGRFIRLQCSDLRMRIPYENLPSCDRLLAICEDIYSARAQGELEVEEVLYWTLVKIYRSPHMLLEYTKLE